MPRVKKETLIKETPVKETVKETKTIVKKAVGLSVPVYSLEGKESGSMELPKEVFGVKVNKTLLSQALRVYLNNTKAHFSNTKTRGEVQGSTKKIRAQKGTGGARHGSVRAPIFVGGGIALGPKFRKVTLELPKKMKKAALLSALSDKVRQGAVLGLTGAEKASGKTAQVRNLLKNIGKKSALVVIEGKNESLSRAVRNLSGVNILTFDQLNVLEAIQHQALVFTKEAVVKLESKVKNSDSEKTEKKEETKK